MEEDMSKSSSVVGDAGRVSGQKNTFTQTCNLLSQYLKEKRSFGDLSLGINSANIDVKGASTDEYYCPRTTMNLFPIHDYKQVEVKEEFCNPNTCSPVSGTMMNSINNSFPPNAIHLVKPAAAAATATSTMESQKSQMTIFYGGQVIVFNDFPAEKAKEIMELAARGTSSSKKKLITNNTTVAAASSAPASASASVTNNLAQQEQQMVLAPKTCSPISPPISGNKPIQNQVVQPRSLAPTTTVFDLPIARKASLHRFLEKRKDRITAKAPYSSNSASAASAKQQQPIQDKSSSWLGLSAQPTPQPSFECQL